MTADRANATNRTARQTAPAAGNENWPVTFDWFPDVFSTAPLSFLVQRTASPGLCRVEPSPLHGWISWLLLLSAAAHYLAPDSPIHQACLISMKYLKRNRCQRKTELLMLPRSTGGIDIPKAWNSLHIN